MTVRLPTNGAGTTLETRTVGGRDRQMVVVAEPVRPMPTKGTTGRVIYKEDFRGVRPGLWNDGLGYIMSDNDITLGGLPSLRLDTGGASAGATSDPGRTANTSGVVAKRRIHDNWAGRWGLEAWFKFTSLNNTSNSKLSMSIYNRNGTQAKHFRVWLDPAGNNTPMHGRILDGAATAAANPGTPTTGTNAVYADVLTSTLQNGGGSHTYDPATGRLDLAGGWHWVKMVVDFATGQYISLQLDSLSVDLTAGSGYFWDITDTTGFAGMHHSFEYHGNTTTRRFVNIANVIGTLED